MATISTSGIAPSQIIKSEHLLRIINALNGTTSNDIIISGSLNVIQGITGTTNVFLQNGNSFGAQALLGTNDSQSLALETNNTTRMFISANGNIGVGTTNFATPSFGGSIPNFIIDNTEGPVVQLRKGSSTLTGQTLGAVEFISQDSSAFKYLAGRIKATSYQGASGAASGGSHITFETGTGTTGATISEAMRIAATRNILIGTTVDNGTNKLQVSGSLNVTGDITGSISNVKVTDNQSFDFTYHPVFTQAAGNTTLQIDTSAFTYNPSSETLRAGNLLLSNFGNRILTMEALTAGGAEIKLLPNSFSGHAKINVGNSNAPLDFQMNSANVMRITQAELIGIGTTNPTGKLTVETSVTGPINPQERAAIYANNTSTEAIYANSIGLYAKSYTTNGFAVYGESTSTGYGGYFLGKGYFSGNVEIGGSTNTTGSVTINSILTLPPTSSLPTGAPTGSFIVSGSNGACRPYFYNGSTWTALF